MVRGILHTKRKLIQQSQAPLVNIVCGRQKHGYPKTPTSQLPESVNMSHYVVKATLQIRLPLRTKDGEIILEYLSGPNKPYKFLKVEDYGRIVCQKDAKWEDLHWSMMVLKMEEGDSRNVGEKAVSEPGAQIKVNLKHLR